MLAAYQRGQQWPRSCTHLTPLSTKSPHAPAASASAPGSSLHCPSNPKNISTPNGDMPVNTDGATLSRKHDRTIRAHTNATSAPYRKSTMPPSPPIPSPPRRLASSRTSVRLNTMYLFSALPPTFTHKRSHSLMNAAYSARTAILRIFASLSSRDNPATTKPLHMPGTLKHHTNSSLRAPATPPTRENVKTRGVTSTRKKTGTQKRAGRVHHQTGSRTRPTQHPHALYDQSVCGALRHAFTNTTLTPAARPSSTTRLLSLALVTTITIRVNWRHAAAALSVSPQSTQPSVTRT